MLAVLLKAVVLVVPPFVAAIAGMMLYSAIRSRKPESCLLCAFDLESVVDKDKRHILITKYFEALVAGVESANKSILVLDYLAHHPALKVGSDSYFFDLYEKYFKLIERLVIEKGIQYERVFQLPLSPRSEASRDEQVEQAVRLMFTQTHSHVNRMLHSGKGFRAYILDAAFRPCSFMIIDDNIIMSEYDRYDSRGVSRPDHLFVNRVVGADETSDSIRDWIASQRSWIEYFTRGAEPIRLDEFLRATEQNAESVPQLPAAEATYEVDREHLQDLEAQMVGFRLSGVRKYTELEQRSAAVDAQAKLEALGHLHDSELAVATGASSPAQLDTSHAGWPSKKPPSSS